MARTLGGRSQSSRRRGRINATPVMALREAAVLHAVFWIYLLAGAAGFYWIELTHRRPLQRATLHGEASESNPFCAHLMSRVGQRLDTFLSSNESSHVHHLVGQSCADAAAADAADADAADADAADADAAAATDAAIESDAGVQSWDYASALFLAMTITTTIGYGTYAPQTQIGKIFTIAYAILGIALAGLALTSTSGYLSGHLVRLYKHQLEEHRRWQAVAVAAVAFLVPGLLLFVFVPAAVFAVIEGWTYLDGVYFAVVSLTTIGFGDLVPGQHGWFYRLALINWIIIGTSYFAVFISFVSKAMSFKRLRDRIPAIVAVFHSRAGRADAGGGDGPNRSRQCSVGVECVEADETGFVHDGWVSAVHCCQQWVLTGSYDSSLRLWNTDGTQRLTVASHRGPVSGVTWLGIGDGDAATFASVSHDQTLMCWRLDLQSQRLDCWRTGGGHQRPIECVAADANGQLVATGGADNLVNVWPAAPDADPDRAGPVATEPLRTLTGHRGAVSGAAWTAERRLYTSSWDGTVRQWDVETGRVKVQPVAHGAATPLTSLARSPLTGALLVASSDGLVRLYDPRVRDGSTVRATFAAHSSCVSTVRWSTTEERLFVTGGHDGAVKLWDVRRPATSLCDVTRHQDKVLCADWSNTRLIVTGGADNTLRIVQSTR